MPKFYFIFWFLVASVVLFLYAQPIAVDEISEFNSSDLVYVYQDRTPHLDVPPRDDSNLTGSEFVSKYFDASQEKREDAIISEVTSGNIPDFFRNLVGISANTTLDTADYSLTYFVTPDYLSVGSDTDQFLAPLSPISAQLIADSLGAMLPTRVMVDQIWAAADLKLEPQPIAPSDTMTSLSVMRIHDRMVFDQRSEYLGEFPLESLAAGHKKDVILSNKIFDHPKAPRVVIYGWHQADGSPIQPAYNGHAAWYADYSHGIRLVSRKAVLNGNLVDLMEILCDEHLHKLISDEGPICRAYPRN